MRRFLKWLKEAKKAAPFKNIFLQIIDVILTKIRVNISPTDYYYFEFFKRDKTWKQRERYIGMVGSLYWPYDLNRLKFNVTLTNKYVQKCLFIGFGLPTPRLITTIGNDFQIKTIEELRRFLSGCKEDIVCKPVSSRGGVDVLVLKRAEHSFFMNEEEFSPEKIWRHITPHLKKGFLVEERVSNNDQLNSLFPHSLNCFRVVTIKLPNQPCHLLTWGLKLGRGRNVVDNIVAGGIFVLLDGKGRIIMGYSKGYFHSFPHHPDTGSPLAGVQLEGTEAVRALGLEASQKFGFVGTIGWDIGLTGNGPVVIEANNMWGPQDQKKQGGHVSDEMKRGLKRHPFLSRWDRKCLFPRFNRKMKAFRN